MDRYRLRGEWVDWISKRGYTQTATLVFNDYEITRFGAIRHLKHFHALMDEFTLGNDWAKRDPITERMLRSIVIRSEWDLQIFAMEVEGLKERFFNSSI